MNVHTTSICFPIQNNIFETTKFFENNIKSIRNEHYLDNENHICAETIRGKPYFSKPENPRDYQNI